MSYKICWKISYGSEEALKAPPYSAGLKLISLGPATHVNQ